ncbi:hydroxyproline dehydrogenase isoform X1 [Brienomyrus brachyistius]|uniref:hydroxyproline dehydrogenase isoform X1 n=1 Tax=Brienomyrus brachyistius TaxID=42636 RepID=UPI0020B17DE8|nr:hydroxyproline dehydrogenase isoform X1 [Brienomyrus brachyistius]
MSTLIRPSLHHLSVPLLRRAAPKVFNSEHLPALHSCMSSLPPDLKFEDPSAFSVKSFRELMRALGVFQLCSFPVLVNNCGKLLSAARSILGKQGFSLIMRPSIYAQFVAGESEGEIAVAMEKMRSLGLRTMLAVPIEEDLGESTGEHRYDENLEAMLQCVYLSHSKACAYPKMQLKITALLSPELCVKITSNLPEYPFDLAELVKAMDGEPVRFPGLTEEENAHFHCGLRRLNKVGEASFSKVRVLVDAEYTYMNPALSLVTMAMMKKFNQKEPWVWNTFQCYLKESRSLLLDAISQSVKHSFCLGVKLVRGAYMDKERKLAKGEGRPDPIHQSWEDTNASYNGSMDIMLNMISQNPQRYQIIVATHNEESVRHAVSQMVKLRIDKHAGSVCFGQLLGMCDHVSLTLAQHGYSVYKSVPYGSVDDTLPYLVRRAQENRTVLQGIRKERDLLRQELRRRLKEGLRLRRQVV